MKQKTTNSMKHFFTSVILIIMMTCCYFTGYIQAAIKYRVEPECTDISMFELTDDNIPQVQKRCEQILWAKKFADGLVDAINDDIRSRDE